MSQDGLVFKHKMRLKLDHKLNMKFATTTYL